VEVIQKVVIFGGGDTDYFLGSLPNLTMHAIHAAIDGASY